MMSSDQQASGAVVKNCKCVKARASALQIQVKPCRFPLPLRSFRGPLAGTSGTASCRRRISEGQAKEGVSPMHLDQASVVNCDLTGRA